MQKLEAKSNEISGKIKEACAAGKIDEARSIAENYLGSDEGKATIECSQNLKSELEANGAAAMLKQYSSAGVPDMAAKAQNAAKNPCGS